MCRRLEAISQDHGDPATWDVHHWQDLNPVICEGLVQLMLGAPAPLYQGGLLHGSVRYFDPKGQRPGLPSDVAALVSHIDRDGIDVQLVNLNPLEERRVILQAGIFGEHRFISMSQRDDLVSGVDGSGGKAVSIDSSTIEVLLGPSAGGCLRLAMERYVGKPGYGLPPMPG